jgi:hypothetical protein
MLLFQGRQAPHCKTVRFGVIGDDFDGRRLGRPRRAIHRHHLVSCFEKPSRTYG